MLPDLRRRLLVQSKPLDLRRRLLVQSMPDPRPLMKVLRPHAMFGMLATWESAPVEALVIP